MSEAVIPAGAPLTARLTVPAEPEVTAVLMVEVPEVARSRTNGLGEALIEKSDAGTVRLMLVACVLLAPLAVIVRG